MAFCPNCGTQNPDSTQFCSNCGAPMNAQQAPQQNFQQAPQQNFQQAPQQNFQQAPQQNFQQAPQPVDPQVSSKNTLAIVLGVAGLVLGIIGAMLLGIILSLPALAASIVAAIMAVGVKKATNNQIGSGAFILSILAIAFSAIFTIGCVICGASCSGYGMTGCVGAGCAAENELDDLSDYYDDIDWDSYFE